MQRKNALITMATLVGSLASSSSVLAAASGPSKGRTVASVPNLGKALNPPAHGPVQVGLVIGPNLVAIDLFGPMAAFGDAFVGQTMDMMAPPLFNTYTVAATMDPIDLGALKIQPQYSFENAPQPHVLVVPAQKSLPATLAWVKSASVRADVTMSVCTGAFLVAKTGLFDGLKVTTHHGGYDAFEKMFPQVTLIRGPKYVENRKMSASGGESSGIDLALRVVERYYGPQVAKNAAYNMEYRRTQRPQSISEV
jgi:transcriptional regulator GlxA family with amidase domain